MIEIERKFLVRGDFASYAVKREHIAQGYLCVVKERTVRVRTLGESAYITIKGLRGKTGFLHSEFEYDIPYADAMEIMKLTRLRIEKERYYVPAGEHTFEVDVFHGLNEGLIIAEIELSAEDEPFIRPVWLGEEVTGDYRYYNSYLAGNKITSLNPT